MPTEPTPQAAQAAAEYEFGPFRLDAGRRALYRGGEFVQLTPKAAEMLVLLVEEAGRVVTKEQILERAWPGVVVEEGTIANNISALRKILDAAFQGESPIATVARRGYRFTAPVRRAAAPAATPAPVAGKTITDRDTILLGEIENKTGDAVFDGTLKQALLLHLAQSPFLQLLADRKVRTALQAMERPMDTPVVADVALEMCQRTGAAAAITGTIHSLGDDYIIGIVAVDGNNGDVLVSEQARAHGKGEVLRALDSAALNVRAKLGESLASVNRFSVTFDEVATSSLDALKAYTIARREQHERGDTAAIPHQLRAIELDPNFASAHSALSIALANMGEHARAQEHIKKSHALRDRVGMRESNRIVATYHHLITGDLHKSIDALDVWAKNYPRDAVPNLNIGSHCMTLGQWDKALVMTERAMLAESSIITHSNHAIILTALGRYDDARRTIEAPLARGVDSYYLRLDAYLEAFLRGDDEAMRRHYEVVMGRQGEEDFLIASQAETEAYFGRLDRARELTERAAESALRAGTLETSATWLAVAAVREVELGFTERAIGLADRALNRSAGLNVRSIGGYALARAGDRTVVDQIIRELDRDRPHDSIVQRYWLPCMRAAQAFYAGDWQATVRALEQSESVELGLTVPLEGGLMVPPYLRGLAYAAGKKNDLAAREFAKIEARPGIIKNFVIYPLAVKARAAALAV